MSLAVANSGGLRGSFEIGQILMGDLLTVLPFENTFDVIKVKGRTLKKLFERSAGRLSPDGQGEPGGFLQVSGFQITFDLRRDVGDRVVELLVRCSRCKVPRY